MNKKIGELEFNLSGVNADWGELVEQVFKAKDLSKLQELTKLNYPNEWEAHKAVKEVMQPMTLSNYACNKCDLALYGHRTQLKDYQIIQLISDYIETHLKT